ncbi:MAG: hypothetical protein JXP34_18925 [Planctomycetes bacterium]|nr:hypothetical protein [Planctomycetota bacterium]
MIHFRCRACNEPLTADDAEAGRPGRCPNCGAAYRAPARRDLAPSLARDVPRASRRERGIESFFLAVGMLVAAALAIGCAGAWLYGIAIAFRDFQGLAIAAAGFFGFCLSSSLFIVFRKVRRL